MSNPNEIETALDRLNEMMARYTDQAFTDPFYERKRKGLDEFSDWCFRVEYLGEGEDEIQD